MQHSAIITMQFNSLALAAAAILFTNVAGKLAPTLINPNPDP